MSNELTKKTSRLSAPSKWQEKYILKRIDADDIEITLDTRNAIIESMRKGSRFIQMGKYTFMVNTIRSIEPKYGDAKNTPPCPKVEYTDEWNEERQLFERSISNKAEIEEWAHFCNNDVLPYMEVETVKIREH